MKLSFIALKSTRYSDSQSILTAYSRELGRVSMAVPAGKGKGASRIRALTMPLSILECETDVKPGREVMPIRQVRPVIVLGEVHTHPVKQMLAMFLPRCCQSFCVRVFLTIESTGIWKAP